MIGKVGFTYLAVIANFQNNLKIALDEFNFELKVGNVCLTCGDKCSKSFVRLDQLILQIFFLSEKYLDSKITEIEIPVENYIFRFSSATHFL